MSEAVDRYINLWADKTRLEAQLRGATDRLRVARNNMTPAEEAELHQRVNDAHVKAEQPENKVIDVPRVVYVDPGVPPL